VAADYYGILEISQDASQEEVRKSYRLLVRKHHPDSGNEDRDEATFHLVQEAWEVLGDPSRRKEYDAKHLQKDWDSIRENKLKTFQEKRHQFDEFGTESNRDPRATSGAWSYPKPKSHQRNTTLGSAKTIFNRSDTLLGRMRTIAHAAKDGSTFAEKIRLASDAAKRAKEGGSQQGSLIGKRTFVVTIDALESIHGSSREIVVLTTAGERRVSVALPAGVNSGANLNIELGAEESFPAQTVTVKVNVEAHEYIRREGLDIVLRVPITIGEALLGTEVDVPTIEGSASLKIAPGHGLGKKLRVKGKGIDSGRSVGDMYLIPEIVLPEIERVEAERLKMAAKVVDELYVKDVRSPLPRTLGSR
jgi:molecular chaperone DnaJ